MTSSAPTGRGEVPTGSQTPSVPRFKSAAPWTSTGINSVPSTPKKTVRQPRSCSQGRKSETRSGSLRSPPKSATAPGSFQRSVRAFSRSTSWSDHLRRVPSGTERIRSRIERLTVALVHVSPVSSMIRRPTCSPMPPLPRWMTRKNRVVIAGERPFTFP